MEKVLKFIHETQVEKLVESPQIEVKEENGQKIEIKRTIKTAKPIKVAILKPDRKLFRAAEMFYAKSLSEYLKQGLLPYSLVAKRYANDGGPLTDQEKKRLGELRKEAEGLEAEFYGKIANTDDASKKEKNEVLLKITKINTEVNTIQNAYADIFDTTAEMKARNDTIEWWSLFLTYINLEDKEYTPMLGDGDYDSKVAKLEDIEDRADPFEIEVIKRLAYLISFWFTARTVVSKVDFDSMEKLYLDTVTEYKVSVEPETKITDKTEPPAPTVAPVPVPEPVATPPAPTPPAPTPVV